MSRWYDIDFDLYKTKRNCVGPLKFIITLSGRQINCMPSTFWPKVDFLGALDSMFSLFVNRKS